MDVVPIALSDALREIFGAPRSERLIEIEYWEGAPQLRTWNGITACIALGKQCQSDRLLYIFQLAHELVHTLDPIEFGQASVLEEGAATFFQHWFIRERLPFEDERRSRWSWPEESRYKPAHDLVCPILDRDLYTLRGFRDAGNWLSAADSTVLTTAIPSLEPSAAEELVQRFEEWSRCPRSQSSRS